MRLKKTEKIPKNLTGYLLVAAPPLLDPNFHRTIIFLSHHDPECGAVGFVLNRPSCKSLGILTSAPAWLSKVPVYQGGPVEVEHVILTRILWLAEGVRFESFVKEDLSETFTSQNPDQSGLRAFIGHAGWSTGQLESEISEKSWVVLDPMRELLEPLSDPLAGVTRWRAAMKSLGPWYHLMAQAPDDLGMN